MTQVEGPQDSSEVGKEGEASTAEEERLAAEKSRRLREDLAQVSAIKHNDPP